MVSSLGPCDLSPPPKLRRGGNNTVGSNTSFKRINYVDITFLNSQIPLCQHRCVEILVQENN